MQLFLSIPLRHSQCFEPNRRYTHDRKFAVGMPFSLNSSRVNASIKVSLIAPLVSRRNMG